MLLSEDPFEKWWNENYPHISNVTIKIVARQAWDASREYFTDKVF